MNPGRCNKCGAQIIWFHPARKKWVAVDPERVEVGDTEYDRERHGHHYATCKEMKKQEPSRGYIKPESFPTSAVKSDYVRQIPADEEERITQLIEGKRA